MPDTAQFETTRWKRRVVFCGSGGARREPAWFERDLIVRERAADGLEFSRCVRPERKEAHACPGGASLFAQKNESVAEMER